MERLSAPNRFMFETTRVLFAVSSTLLSRTYLQHLSYHRLFCKLSRGAKCFRAVAIMTVVEQPRRLERVLAAREQQDGVGARVRRSIGSTSLERLDPFLLLDHFRVKPPGGFPEHPHRGFQTVTYMLRGKFRHRDNRGHEGVIAAGDMQWMTAGAGIVHSEMPATEEENEGLQIWVNLAAKNKLVPPSYQEKRATDIPSFATADEHVRVKVLAGVHEHVRSDVATLTPTEMLDVMLAPHTSFQHPLPATWNACIYVLDGLVHVGAEKISAGNLGVFESDAGDGIRIESGDTTSRILFLCGEPLREPVAHYGPIVMNTREEIMQAISDYQAGKF